MSRHFVNFLLLALVGGFFYLTSCSKSDLISNQLTTEETQINAALENAEDNNLLPGTTLEIRGGGDVVDPDSLPQTIIDYVDLNYPDSVSITKALHLKNGQYAIRISNGKILLFDENGQFIKEIPSRRDHKGHHGDPRDSTHRDSINRDSSDHHHGRDSLGQHHDRDSTWHHDRDSTDHHDRDSSGHHHVRDLTPIALDALPAAILQYFAEHYPTAELKKAAQNNNNQEYGVEVIIDNKRYVFFFDANGVFLRKRP